MALVQGINYVVSIVARVMLAFVAGGIIGSSSISGVVQNVLVTRFGRHQQPTKSNIDLYLVTFVSLASI